MKKMFTLILVTAGTIGAASAQPANHQSVAYNDSKKMSGQNDAGFGKTNSIAFNDAFLSYKAKDAKLKEINREFDQEIALVKTNRHLSSRQKARQIQLLQDQRKKEISKMEFQYAKSNMHDSHKW
jgi:hypothetical protein